MIKKIASLLNSQFKKELESAYIYLYFASYFDSQGLTGFSHWFKKQALEEEEHAMRIYSYLHEQKEPIQFTSIDAPKLDSDSIIQVLNETLEQEEYISRLINNIYYETTQANDYSTKNFLEWFIGEQREEEKQIQDIITKYTLFCIEGTSLFQLNKELAER